MHVGQKQVDDEDKELIGSLPPFFTICLSSPLVLSMVLFIVGVVVGENSVDAKRKVEGSLYCAGLLLDVAGWLIPNEEMPCRKLIHEVEEKPARSKKGNEGEDGDGGQAVA